MNQFQFLLRFPPGAAGPGLSDGFSEERTSLLTVALPEHVRIELARPGEIYLATQVECSRCWDGDGWVMTVRTLREESEANEVVKGWMEKLKLEGGPL